MLRGKEGGPNGCELDTFNNFGGSRYISIEVLTTLELTSGLGDLPKIK